MVICRKNSRGFSLVEMLITMSLISIIGLVIFSAFSNSLKVYQRINQGTPAQDIGLSFERLARDLRNSFLFSGIKFEGTKDGLSFPSLIYIVQKNQIHQEPGRVEYIFDKGKKELLRKQFNYSQIYQDKDVPARSLVSGIEEMAFRYYYFSQEKNSYFWSNTCKGGIPLAVVLDITAKGGKFSLSWPKIVSMPVAENYNPAPDEASSG